jgi:hypothetical protein
VEKLLSRKGFGAGEGNRTLVCSLGSCRSTIELRPHVPSFSRDRTVRQDQTATLREASAAPAEAGADRRPRTSTPPSTLDAFVVLPDHLQAVWSL